MNLSSKRDLIARMLGVGKERIAFDPERLEDIEDAVTRDEIRALISQGAIKLKPIRGQSRRQKERRAGQGSRKGKKGARMGKKIRWVRQVRALRGYLKKVKPNISREMYWELYRRIKGGEIRTVARLKEAIGGAK